MGMLDIVNIFSEKPKKYFELKKTYKKNNKLKNIPENSYPVKCMNGTFIGTIKEDIISYKGIPFARPPTNNLRWKPPIDCEKSDDIYEAYYFQKSPIQVNDPGEVASFYEIGEDCLYLNIWKYNDNNRNKPVMIFIHGGGFGWGGSVDPLYNGHNFVKAHKDIILITITYRVAILGFLDLTQIKGGENYKESPNLGILDQIQAIKWVNQNIENFGGDKNNVTIFGESAGGASVTLLPLIKRTKGLFKKIISQSGTFAWTISREEGKLLINSLKSILKKENKELTVDYLTNLSEEEIIKLNKDLNFFCLPPMRDGYIIPEDCYKAVENGAFKNIDIIIGNNADETRYWIQECGYYFLYKICAEILLENIIKYRIKKNGDKIFQKYKEVVKENTTENFLIDIYFRSPALKIAEIHSKNNGNIYLYNWTYPSSIKNYGACHAVELAYIFNNLGETHFIGNKNINYKLAEISQDMWVNFAKFGNPSTEDYIWKKYDSDNNYVMNFGKEIKLEHNKFSKERNIIIENILNEYILIDYSSVSLNVPIIRKILYIFLFIMIMLLSLFINKYIGYLSK